MKCEIGRESADIEIEGEKEVKHLSVHTAIRRGEVFFADLHGGVGTTLVMHSSRSAEYEADEFAFHLGFGDALCALLDRIGGERETGLFARLASSHPDKNSRIAHLQQLGAYTMPFRN